MTNKAIYILGLTDGKLPLTRKALIHAHTLHEGQTRDDGSPYVDHCIEACYNLIMLGVRDDNVLAAILLHDTVEDTIATYEYICLNFNKTVAEYVMSVTKTGSMEESCKEISKDVRRVLIKGADRNHNCRTMINFPINRLQKYINETEFLILPMIKNASEMCLEYGNALASMYEDINALIKYAKEVLRLRLELEKINKKPKMK